MIQIYFGKNLKTLRKNKGLTQTDISSILETNKSLIANYESDRHYPSIETIIKIADYFSVSIDALLRQDMSAAVNSIVVSEPAAAYRLSMGVGERLKELEALLAAKNELIEMQKKHIELLENNLRKI